MTFAFRHPHIRAWTGAPLLAGLVMVALTVVSGDARSQGKDNPQCKPNPVFSKFPNSYYYKCDRSKFGKVEIQVSKDKRESKEGEYWSYFSYINKDKEGRLPSSVEVVRNYSNAVGQAGGSVLHELPGRSVFWTIKRPDGVYWGESGCGGGGTNDCNSLLHKIVKETAMEQAVVVTAEQIRRALSDTGKVVFYGIYFDFDKATIKPESKPTLEEMAKFLKANSVIKVYIVGHTDMKGGHDYNLKLSRERAAAVVQALVSQHGIAKDRLASDGVGPLAPVAANDSDVNRARNRRVEMVLR
ncbi:MAG: hypothetical protein A3F74_23865 [Betaproteobacteria bacterium RIFCSPLOWO2_12_FULL_62_58]|nr:MAG: hypothetical protein A3F74_23865 [Betaproteobacteria bacterium RIFCSPLOWO2_12_FULL_62_58]